jgi:hypothetical protein
MSHDAEADVVEHWAAIITKSLAAQRPDIDDIDDVAMIAAAALVYAIRKGEATE